MCKHCIDTPVTVSSTSQHRRRLCHYTRAHVALQNRRRRRRHDRQEPHVHRQQQWCESAVRMRTHTYEPLGRVCVWGAGGASTLPFVMEMKCGLVVWFGCRRTLLSFRSALPRVMCVCVIIMCLTVCLRVCVCMRARERAECVYAFPCCVCALHKHQLFVVFLSTGEPPVTALRFRK